MAEQPKGNGPEHEVDIIRETELRYAGFATRVVRLAAMMRSARYLAFTSDVGEALRPVVSPVVVRASYGVVGAYVLADVGYHTWRAKEHGLDPTRAFAHATTFNALANLALPAVIIHTQVHVAARIFKSIGKFTKYGPTLAGLALIPALPYICDHPVENVITQLFDKVWPEPTAREKNTLTEEALQRSWHRSHEVK